MAHSALQALIRVDPAEPAPSAEPFFCPKLVLMENHNVRWIAYIIVDSSCLATAANGLESTKIC